MNTEWTQVEEAVLREYFQKESLSTLASMLPGRSQGAIVNRAQTLGLHKKQVCKPIVQERSMDNINTIEQLEAEVAVKRAQLEVEEADRALAIFDEQLIAAYTQEVTPKVFVKEYTKQRGKLVQSVSRARLKLAIARMEQKGLS
jgi:hypothetical protein